MENQTARVQSCSICKCCEGQEWEISVKLSDGRELCGHGAIDPVPNWLDVIDRPLSPTLLEWLTAHAIAACERQNPRGVGWGAMGGNMLPGPGP